MRGGAPTEDDHRRCTANRSRGQGRCRAWAVKGATVCVTHGGAAPQVRAAAAARVELAQLEDRASRHLRRRLGGALDCSPVEAVRALLRFDAADVEVLRDLVAELPGARAVTDVVAVEGPGGGIGSREVVTEPGLYGPNHNGDDVPHVLVTMWRQRLADLRDTVKIAAALGIAEDAGAIEAELVQAIAGMLETVARDPRVSLTPAQRAAFLESAREGLLRLEGSVAA